MQGISSPQEVAELELALENTRKAPAFRSLLLFFWGLIIAKCLLAQWVLITYRERIIAMHGTPINGFVFVWIPSFLISGAITIYYSMKVFHELPRMPLSGRVVSATWLACGVAFLVLVTAVVADGEFSLYVLPAFAAVLLGVGFFIHSVMDRRVVFKVAAAGWWGSALWLFAHRDVNALAGMALALYLFQVAPAGWLYFTGPKTGPAGS